MTRVAYVCADPGVPVFGRKGASVHVQEVIRALRRRGATVELFATRLGAPVPPGLDDLVVHRLPPVAEGTMAQRERSGMAANAGLTASLAAAAAARGRFDLVYERYALWSTAGMAHARHTGADGVLEVNAPLIDEQRRHRGLVHAEDARCSLRALLDMATRVFAVSGEVADWVAHHGPPRSRITIVPNGVDARRFRAVADRNARAGGAADGFTAGFVGTLKPWHGVDLLVEAVGRLVARGTDARLLIVGEGPRRAALEEAVAARGLGRRVEWTGAVDHADVPELLARMDVGCAPYPDLPGFYFSPMKVYEYLAAGLPVVASRIGQLTQAVDHGRTGLLYRPGDVDGLTAALAALAGDPHRRAALGRAGRRQVVRSHSWDAVADRILGGTPSRDVLTPRREVA